MTKTILMLGYGYTAATLANRLRREGWSVVATTRDPDKADRLQADGVEALLWPGVGLGPVLARVDAVLSSVAPGPEGDPVLAAEAAAFATARHLAWVGYLSTTGVYGDHQGGWVDEHTPLTPATKRGRARMQAEAAWQAVPGLALHIFRLPGIYGPGRGPIAKLQAGRTQAVIKPGQVFSRAHVEDIASALALSLSAPNPGAVYNICDDQPAPPEEVLDAAADVMGVARPERVAFEAAELSPMARSFYAESKRVSNAKIKRELGWAPQYPGYVAGLEACWAAEQSRAGMPTRPHG